MLSISQIIAEYHRKILRIPYGNQHPTKRYLTDAQILELFDGEVYIQEKVDGKLTGCDSSPEKILVVEDMTGKNTVHNHVMEYTALPKIKMILLDEILVTTLPNDKFKIKFCHPIVDKLTYAKIKVDNPTIKEIHLILSTFSQMKSHFGSDFIEGLVIKNYKKQLMAKWINDRFEDRLP